MSDQEDKSLYILIGKLDGKLDGLMNSMQLINATFASHATSDDANFEKLRVQMAKDKEDMNVERNKIAKVTVVLLFIASTLSLLAPIIIPIVVGKLNI